LASEQARQRRDVDGVLLLDKPPGWTSNQALQQVKRLYRARKAGHTGSLDPLASGLLPVCLGQATKVSAFLLDADKHYLVTARLGVKTDTGDADGRVVARSDPAAAVSDREALARVLRAHTRPIDQVPPMYSALKQRGRRLYELARAGVEVERAPRRVTIHALDLVSLDGDRLTLEVRCSKGTYVRTLVEDVAEALGTHAHVVELRRLGVGPYSGGGMLTMAQLEALAESGDDALDAVLLPIDSAAAQWPAVQLPPDGAHYLLSGQAVRVRGAPQEGWVRLYGEGLGFLGIGSVTEDGRVAPRRLLRRAAATRRLLPAGDSD
jgi:tRNA pseudouridine55 synthase